RVRRLVGEGCAARRAPRRVARDGRRVVGFSCEAGAYWGLGSSRRVDGGRDRRCPRDISPGTLRPDTRLRVPQPGRRLLARAPPDRQRRAQLAWGLVGAVVVRGRLASAHVAVAHGRLLSLRRGPGAAAPGECRNSRGQRRPPLPGPPGADWRSLAQCTGGGALCAPPT